MDGEFILLRPSHSEFLPLNFWTLDFPALSRQTLIIACQTKMTKTFFLEKLLGRKNYEPRTVLRDPISFRKYLHF
jgi:hypothetical protein